MPIRRTHFILALSFGLLAVIGNAGASDLEKKGGEDGHRIIYIPARGTVLNGFQNKACGITYHGGPLMTSPARLVYSGGRASAPAAPTPATPAPCSRTAISSAAPVNGRS